MDISKLYRTMEPTLYFLRSTVAISLILGGLIDWKGLKAQEPSLPISSHVEEYLHNYSNLIRFGSFYQGTVAIRNDEGCRVLKVKGFYAQDKDQDCVRVDDQVTDGTSEMRYSREPSSFLRVKDKSFLFSKGLLTQDTAENMRLMERPARFNPIDLPILSPHMITMGYSLKDVDQLTIFDPNRFYQESHRSDMDIGIYRSKQKFHACYYGFDPLSSMLLCTKFCSQETQLEESLIDWKPISENRITWYEFDDGRFVPVNVNMEMEFNNERLEIKFKLAWLIDQSLPDSVFDPARLIRGDELEQLRSICMNSQEEMPKTSESQKAIDE